MKVIVRFTEEDIFANTRLFNSHRDYIEWRFLQMGYKVTKWSWERPMDSKRWHPNPDGVEMKRADSDIQLTFEVIGTVGKNIRELTAEEKLLRPAT